MDDCIPDGPTTTGRSSFATGTTTPLWYTEDGRRLPSRYPSRNGSQCHWTKFPSEKRTDVYLDEKVWTRSRSLFRPGLVDCLEVPLDSLNEGNGSGLCPRASEVNVFVSFSVGSGLHCECKITNVTKSRLNRSKPYLQNDSPYLTRIVQNFEFVVVGFTNFDINLSIFFTQQSLPETPSVFFLLPFFTLKAG